MTQRFDDLPNMADSRNPFDFAYLGAEPLLEEGRVRAISVRIPERWIDIARQFANDARLPYNHNTSSLYRAGIIKYLMELAGTLHESEVMQYMQSLDQLKHNAQRQVMAQEFEQSIGHFEYGLVRDMRLRRLRGVYEILRDLQTFINTSTSEQFRTDGAFIVSKRPVVLAAVKFIVDAWSKAEGEYERRAAEGLWQWWQELQALYGGQDGVPE